MSRNRLAGRGRQTDGPSTDRARALLGPGAPVRSCRCACRCGRWPARPAPRSGTGIIAGPAPAAPPLPAPDRLRPEIRTRSPPASSISIRPEGGSSTGGIPAGAIATAAKPGARAVGTVRSIPAQNSLRQAKSWLGLTPCRRATPCTVSPVPASRPPAGACLLPTNAGAPAPDKSRPSVRSSA